MASRVYSASNSNAFQQPMVRQNFDRQASGRGPINTDPGVYEPGDPFKSNFADYPDQDDFLNQLRASQQQVDLTYPVQKEFINGMATVAENGDMANGWQEVDCGDPPPPEEPVAQQPTVANAADLPLANDYQGIGGPSTVPLYSPDAFHRPEVTPHMSCILDDLFLAPSPNQIRAYQKVLTKQEILQTRARLKWSNIVHLFLMLAMLAKLSPEILDKLDIFVLEIEELFLPKPHLWEWIWLVSCPTPILSWLACRKANASMLNKFITLIFLLGLTPILFGMVYHCSDLYEYASTGSKEDLELWSGFPVAVLWYVFFLLAMQAHSFQLYFAGALIKVWRPKPKAQ